MVPPRRIPLLSLSGVGPYGVGSVKTSLDDDYQSLSARITIIATAGYTWHTNRAARHRNRFLARDAPPSPCRASPAAPAPATTCGAFFLPGTT